MTVERDLTEQAKLLEDSATKARSIHDSHGDNPSLKSLLEQFLQNSLQSANALEQFRLFELEGGMQFLVGVQFIGQVPHVWYGDLAQRGARDWIKDTVQASFVQNHVDVTIQQNFHDLFSDILMRKVEATQMDLGAGIIPIVNNSRLEDTLQSMQRKMHEFQLNELQPKAASMEKKSISPAQKLLAGLGFFRKEKKANKQAAGHSEQPSTKPKQ